MPKTLAEKRLVHSKTIYSNATTDGTRDLGLFLNSEMGYFTEIGVPYRLNFYITKNSNPNLTKENGLLDLTIPIIPACYDIKSSMSLSEFVSQAKNSEIIANKYDSIDSEIIDKRINSYVNKIIVYIKNEIAIRYAIAKENKDSKTMQLLSNLDIMKGFDLELYSLLLKQPTKIVESRVDVSTQNNKYVLVFEDGTITPITKQQYKSINSYIYNYNRYVKIAEKFYSLSKIMNDYENYDITKELHESTVPTHSVIARGYSTKTNKRVKKPSMLENTKTTSSNKKSKAAKPSQPGDN